MKHCFLLLLLALSAGAANFDTSDLVRTDAPGTVFTEVQAPAFSLKTPVPGAQYTLADWQGRTIDSGAWPENGLQLQPMPAGYYELTLTAPGHTFTGRRTFAVVVPPERVPAGNDSFLGIDTAQSWLAQPVVMNNERFQGDGFTLVSDLVKLSGTKRVRERMSWGQTNPAPGVFRWGRYQVNADLLHARGIQICGMFHDAAKWSRTSSPKLPDDLVALYRYTRELATHFRGQITAWEFWNEPDIAFAPEPAWDYAACLKAAYLGFKSASPELPVLSGALCRLPRNAYDDALYANDAARYSDVMNFHTYHNLADYPTIFGDLRNFLAKHGVPARPIWVTESGTDNEQTAEESSFIPGQRAHSPSQELLVAEYVPKGQVLMMMEGVSHNYHFVFPPWHEREGKKDWGVLRRDASAKPAYAAIATFQRNLGDARLLGELNAPEGVRAFLFAAPDGSQRVVCWSVSNLDTAARRQDKVVNDRLFEREFRLPVPAGEYQLSDLMGQISNIRAGADGLVLKLNRYPVYIAGVTGLTPATKPHPAGKIAVRTDTGYDASVIVRCRLNPEDFSVTNFKSLAMLSKPTGKMTVEVWNLSDREKTGQLHVSGGTLSNLPETITLPAWGKRELAVELHPATENGEAVLALTGTFEGRDITRWRMPYMALETVFRNAASQVLHARAENWRVNSSGKSTVSFDAAENALRFDTVWDAECADRWTYPEYPLQLPEESLRDAQLIAFEIKSTQDKVENDFSHANFMFVDRNVQERGRTESVSFQAPTTEWEMRMVPPTALNMGANNVRMIRIGMNPLGRKLTYWIRNLRIIKAPAAK